MNKIHRTTSLTISSQTTDHISSYTMKEIIQRLTSRAFIKLFSKEFVYIVLHLELCLGFSCSILLVLLIAMNNLYFAMVK